MTHLNHYTFCELCKDHNDFFGFVSAKKDSSVAISANHLKN